MDQASDASGNGSQHPRHQTWQKLMDEQVENLRAQQTLFLETLEENRQLKAQLDFIKNEHPFGICLIDGDGAIFEEEYLKNGEAGGKRAALALMNGLKDYVRARPNPPFGLRWMILLFLHKEGLVATFVENNACTEEQASNFFKGFVQADGLINVVDVGKGKEQADNKVREHLSLFLNNHQAKLVFFAGSHDAGYRSTLSSGETAGFRDKMIILQHYSTMSPEIEDLGLPVCKIPGLFRSEVFPRRSRRTASFPSQQMKPNFRGIFDNMSPKGATSMPWSHNRSDSQSSGASLAKGDSKGSQW